jgi:hypothetical protein
MFVPPGLFFLYKRTLSQQGENIKANATCSSVVSLCVDAVL